jgi:hypothetical protein
VSNNKIHPCKIHVLPTWWRKKQKRAQ